jgi:hypothetical protein
MNDKNIGQGDKTVQTEDIVHTVGSMTTKVTKNDDAL